MTKTQLNKLTKAELVEETLQTRELLKRELERSSKAEQIAQGVAEATLELLNDIDLPRKFTFWWIITNFKAIGQFISEVLSSIRDARDQGILKEAK